MLIVFTGDGKGKTTASLGQMVRMLGRDKRVLMIQFIKGPWKSGEDFFEEKFNIPARCFEIRKRGLGFVGILDDNLPIEKHKEAAREALEEFTAELTSGNWNLVVLDEINVAVSLGLISAEDVLRSVENLPAEQYVVFTGRGAPKAFIDRADLVTEMRMVKHPFNEGNPAKAALEF